MPDEAQRVWLAHAGPRTGLTKGPVTARRHEGVGPAGTTAAPACKAAGVSLGRPGIEDAASCCGCATRGGRQAAKAEGKEGGEGGKWISQSLARSGCGGRPDLPLGSAGSDTIRWGRVLLSHTLDAARSY